MLTSREDIAKYSFTKEAAEYIRALDLRIDELVGPEYVRVLDRAEQRVEDALIYGNVRTEDLLEKEVEILSFPIAVLLVAKIDDNFLKRRYSLSEAKRANDLLDNEKDYKVVEIARETFGWKTSIRMNVFYVGLTDYLRNSTIFHDNRWKLINRFLIKGKVQLTKEDFTRLLQEEIRRHIEKRIERSPKVELKPLLSKRIDRLNLILTQRKEEHRIDELPKTTVTDAYPPCIKRLYDSILTGQHISHMGRFTLTSFLLNVGIKTDELTKLYTSTSDFNEEMTRYQVKHIAGETGSRTKYMPPSCSTLKTNSLCPGADQICDGTLHPLNYYRKKLKLIKRP